MKKLTIITIAIALFIAAIAVIKLTPGVSDLIWNASGGGQWLLPLVAISALLDSVHPCSFSILLITIAFLLGLQMTRGKILQIGGLYIAGIFASYFLIGIGLLKVLHIFNVPHFMGKLGAAMLILFGVLNLAGGLFPNFPIRLKIPTMAKTPMARLMNAATLPAAFGLGLLVGLCQFPCMGGPYIMVVGLLHDQVTYMKGFGYLLLYNFILIAPLVAVLVLASQKELHDRVKVWKEKSMKNVHIWAGLAMLIIGLLILLV